MLAVEQRRIEDCAKKLGVHIPDGISIQAWPIVLIEALLKRIEDLENAISKDVRS